MFTPGILFSELGDVKKFIFTVKGLFNCKLSTQVEHGK